jgi:hypothetical protein
MEAWHEEEEGSRRGQRVRVEAEEQTKRAATTKTNTETILPISIPHSVI